ncbi:MAG: NnrS family protein [Pseudomonadota bacterium]
MALISIEESKQKPRPRGFALFALGFRPFFLSAGIFAVIYMGLWLPMLQGALPAPAGLTPMAWHGHEMLFGFTVSVIAGFLLTAAQNWTSIPMLKDGPLAALFALWLAGRIAPYLPMPYVVVALIDLLFLPVLTIAVLMPVLRVRQARNYPFPIMLLGLFVANLLFHAAALGLVPLSPLHGLTLALYLIVLMMVVMGGRVIPYFTERRINSAAKKWPLIEWLAPASALATLVAVLLSQHDASFQAAIIPLAAAAAIVHGIRLAGWQSARLWGIPLLWVLHLGYGWIAVGFALDALAAAGLVSPFLSLHAYATGGIGVLTLGMMSRVSLGHTGRILEAPAIMAWAFVIMNLSAAVRVFGPLLLPAQTPMLHQLGGGLWMAAFTVFAAVYAPMLWRPRADGKAG